MLAQANPALYILQRVGLAAFRREFTLEGSWGGGKKLTKHRGLAALLKDWICFLDAKAKLVF